MARSPLLRPVRPPDRRRPIVAALAALGLAATLAPPQAYAASIVVDSLADTATAADGDCTFREAIHNANSLAGDTTGGDCAAGSAAPTVDTITFSVAGTILTGSALPAIHGSAGLDTGAVRIDGGGTVTLQRSAGSGPGLEIGRSGALTSLVVIRGLTITGYIGAGIDMIRVASVDIESCVIHDNGQQGIRIQHDATTGVTIQGCRIGVDGSGNASGNDDDGIQINDGADGVTIDGNWISANNGNDGIDIRGGGGNGSGHLVENNFIGTDGTGSSCGGPPNTFGNGGMGIDVTGGVSTSTFQNNVIGCNGRGLTTTQIGGHGIEISGASSVDNDILNNYIGTNAGGTDLGNHNNGIHLNSGVDDTTIQGNTIAFNGAGLSASNVHNDGIRIDGSTTDNNRVTQNAIHSNGGTDVDGLGIDLNGDGVQDNDSNDPDSGSNMLTNYPLITSATWVGGLLQVDGCFDGRTGAPSEAPFTLELFCNAAPDASSNGEGQTYAASVVLAADVGTTTYGGGATCTTPGTLHAFLPPAGCVFVASNATNSTGSTSEFGPNAAALACTLTPQTATNILPGDTSHSVTATVARGTTAVASATVDFSVTGTNIVGGPDPVTNGSGVATFGYTSGGTPGADTIAATVTDGGETATCLGPNGTTSVSKTWELPNAVALTSFDGRRIGRSVKLEWRTAVELKHAGFRVLRGDATGRETVLTPRLIAPRGGELGGADYTFVDWAAPLGALSYWLEDVDTLGHASRHGPVALPAARPRTIQLPPRGLPWLAPGGTDLPMEASR
ncbi:hypothetical protein DCC79_01940 [bacterium]|nr:hypothetical protein [Chloroflexi bacterium CFX6]RIL12299.1 MAG: hypothetical protein DCC79_01940 [bacterium]